MIREAFYDELEKIAQHRKEASAGRVTGKLLRVMKRPKQALRVERAGEDLSRKLHRVLMYEPPQPKFLKGKHLPGYRTVAKAISDNPETLPTVAAPPGSGAWTIGLPGYLAGKGKFENYLDGILRHRRREKYKRYAATGAAAVAPLAAFEIGRRSGMRRRSQK
jgi:hypothetical protein